MTVVARGGEVFENWRARVPQRRRREATPCRPGHAGVDAVRGARSRSTRPGSRRGAREHRAGARGEAIRAVASTLVEGSAPWSFHVERQLTTPAARTMLVRSSSFREVLARPARARSPACRASKGVSARVQRTRRPRAAREGSGGSNPRSRRVESTGRADGPAPFRTSPPDAMPTGPLRSERARRIPRERYVTGGECRTALATAR